MNRFSVTLSEGENFTTAFGSAYPVKGEKGEKGDKGDSPVKGVDYYTEGDKEELLTELERRALGDIGAALDGILAIQESLIGGGKI